MVRKGASQAKSQAPQEATKAAVQGVQKPKQAPPAKKISRKFYVDCTAPVEDGIFDLEHFVRSKYFVKKLCFFPLHFLCFVKTIILIPFFLASLHFC